MVRRNWHFANKQALHPIALSYTGLFLSRLLTSLAQGSQKLHPIRFVVENRLAPIAPAHHMITRPSILNAQRPWHNPDHQLKDTAVSIVSSDPFFLFGLGRNSSWPLGGGGFSEGGCGCDGACGPTRTHFPSTVRLSVTPAFLLLFLMRWFLGRAVAL
jgi:hypothetical protein